MPYHSKTGLIHEENAMSTQRPDINGIAKTVIGWMPVLNEEEQKISIYLYRMLSEGEPVAPAGLADTSGISIGRVEKILQSWPGVFYEKGGRINGFWGIAIPKMGHKFKVDGKNLYTWCAWDALFIPEILGKTVEVESTCPITKKSIQLIVEPSGITYVGPKETVVSFLIPEESKVDANVVNTFCHFVHFFSSEDAANKWVIEHQGTFILKPEDAFTLGRVVNQARFGEYIKASNNRRN